MDAKRDSNRAAGKAVARVPLSTKVLPETKQRLASYAKATNRKLSECTAAILDQARLPKITNRRPLEMLALQAALSNSMQREASALESRTDLSDETREAALVVVRQVQGQLLNDIGDAAASARAAGAK